MNFFLTINEYFRCFWVWLGTFFPQLALRLFLAYEFGQAGLNKYKGNNWFATIQDQFPYPFSELTAELNWLLVTWTEMVAAALLVVGFMTRYAAFALIMVDVVAWVSVHGDNGFNVCSNGFKLPLMYLIMLVTLACMGGGKLSLDNLLRVKR